jgi:heme/copper-type cytochrome/quinol oxidase subunit 4
MAHGKSFTVMGVELDRNYMMVWVALLVLTIVEVIVPELSLIPGVAEGAALPRTVEVLSLIGLALIKTYCVAWFYMHLIDENPGIVAIACAPFIFSVFLTIGLFPYSVG